MHIREVRQDGGIARPFDDDLAAQTRRAASFYLQPGDILINHFEDDLIAVIFTETVNRHVDLIAARQDVGEAELSTLINHHAVTALAYFFAGDFQRTPSYPDLGNGLPRSFVHHAPAHLEG